MAGDETTGVQVMQMEAGLDTGPILLSETTRISDDDTASTLHDRLSHIAAQLAPRALSALERGQLAATAQAEQGVIYAEKISPEEARINWNRPAAELDCHVRGLSPFPGAWTTINGERVKVLHSRKAEGTGAPGEVLSVESEIVVACGEGTIALTLLQRAGKKAQAAPEFLRGFAMTPGDKFS